MLVVKPKLGHLFTKPPSTIALHLPHRKIFVVQISKGASADRFGLYFRGGFRSVERPPHVLLGPMVEEDAQGLLAAVNARYGLPRTAQPVEARHLLNLTSEMIVKVTSVYAPNDVSGATFAGTALLGDPRTLVPFANRRVEVIGLFEPRLTGPDDRPIAGFSGPRIEAIDIREA
ncbi:MAG TPA: hypothetical protein VF407_12220 [Polyangiaceae bacterium]